MRAVMQLAIETVPNALRARRNNPGQLRPRASGFEVLRPSVLFAGHLPSGTLTACEPPQKSHDAAY